MNCIAQDRTFGKQRSVNAVEDATIVLVPYEHKMYISDVTRELCEKNELPVSEVRRILREGLSQIVATELSKYATVIDLLNEGEEEKLRDVNEFHAALDYDYIAVPIPDSLKQRKELKSQIGRGTYIEQGEIRSYYDGKERFMDAVIQDKKLIPYWKKRYQPDYVVFLNELDIRVRRDGPPMPGEQRERQIKVHYSIFDGKGKKVNASAVMLNYPYGESNIFDIVRTYFRSIAGSIALELFPEGDYDLPTFILPSRAR